MAKSGIRNLPLHERIANDLRKELSELEVGTKIPVEAELAARYDVSVPTLRIAMTLLVQEGLVVRKHGSGTYISKTRSAVAAPAPIESRRSVGLPVFAGFFAEPAAHEFWLRLYSQLMQGMDECGIRYQLLPFRESQHENSECLDFVRSPDAVALIHLSRLPQQVLEAARENRVAGVGFSSPDIEMVHSIRVDQAKMIQAAMEYFHIHRRQRVSLLAWDPSTLNHQVTTTGAGTFSKQFKSAADNFGISTKDRWICGDLHPANRGAGWSGLREIWSSSSQKPDALLVADSQLMSGVIEAAREMRIRVPEDILILSQSNTPESVAIPAQVARIEYHISDMADAMVEGLKALWRGEPATHREVEILGTLVPHEEGQTPGVFQSPALAGFIKS